MKDRYLEPERVDRRHFTTIALAFAAGTLTAAETKASCKPTSRAIEGPYWRANAPFTNDLHRGKSKPLVVRGTVTDGDCRPLPNILIDVWQADEHGKYDLDYDNGESFLRARLRTDSEGTYHFRTIRPAAYGMGNFMRPAHIHFMFSADGRRKLVTQLYFSGDPMLDKDPLRAVHADLIATPTRRDGEDEVRFDIRLV